MPVAVGLLLIKKTQALVQREWVLTSVVHHIGVFVKTCNRYCDRLKHHSQYARPWVHGTSILHVVRAAGEPI